MPEKEPDHETYWDEGHGADKRPEGLGSRLECGLTAYDAEFVALARTLVSRWLPRTVQFCKAPRTWRCRCRKAYRVW